VTDRHLFLDVYRLFELTGAVVDRQLRDVGIPAYLFGLLSQIRALAPVTPSAISQNTGIATTTLRDNIQRLVDRGLVRRAPNPGDGRSYLVEVTDEGHLLAAAADPALLEAYLALERRLTRPREEYEHRLGELASALAETLEELSRKPVAAGHGRGLTPDLSESGKASRHGSP
jgi:MarR family transcriptional regulator, multiple antibiotic resistance protein MarR